MSMSKKDFIALADVIRDIQRHEFWGLNERESQGAKVAMSIVIEKLSAFCRSQNSNFKRDRWLSYIAGECGPNGGAVKKDRVALPVCETCGEEWFPDHRCSWPAAEARP